MGIGVTILLNYWRVIFNKYYILLIRYISQFRAWKLCYFGVIYFLLDLSCGRTMIFFLILEMRRVDYEICSALWKANSTWFLFRSRIAIKDIVVQKQEYISYPWPSNTHAGTHLFWVSVDGPLLYPVRHRWRWGFFGKGKWSVIGKTAWKREWQPTPVFLPGKVHGQRSLVGYSPWGLRELAMT